MAPGSYFGAISVNKSNAGVPTTIKCIICGIPKGQKSYSAKRLGDLKAKLAQKPHFNAATKGYIPCITCTPHRQEEFRCFWCNKYKGRSEFSKAQLRNTPDEPTCQKCMLEKEAIGAAGADYEDDSSSDSNPGDGDDMDDDDDTSTLTSAMGISTINGTSTYPSYASSSTTGGGVKLNSSNDSGSAMSASTKSSKIKTASSLLPSNFDSNQFGNPSNRPKPVSSVAGSVASSSSAGRFAKLRAVPRPTIKPTASEEASHDSDEGQTINSSESDSDTE